MRVYILAILLFYAVLTSSSQNAPDTGILLYEGIFDDFEVGAWWSGGVNFDGVFDDVEGNETGVFEFSTNGSSVNPWDEQMGVNWDTPEGSTNQPYRVQFRVRADHAPYNIPTHIQINQDPWSGITTTISIPAGFEQQWLFFDFLLGPSTLFNTADMGLRFQLGTQDPQILDMDDIRVYLSEAIGIFSYEGRIEERLTSAIGGTLAYKETMGAPNGIRVAEFSTSTPGSGLGDVTFAGLRVRKPDNYDGSYRFNIALRSDKAPLNLQAGIAQDNQLTQGFVLSPETQTITVAGEWQTLSFPVPPVQYTGNMYAFLQMGGQGSLKLEADNAVLMRTAETVEGPVSVYNWDLF